MRKTTFALYFGNRGFFPASLIESARQELPRILQKMNCDSLITDASLTRHGAVETVEEGRRYARFLEDHKGKYDGVIVSLPNFGDENGAVAALKEAGVPIFIHAYPDDLDKMAPELRRDSFCGKLSIMDVMLQYGIPFTVLKPHVASPHSPAFSENIKMFKMVCEIYRKMKNLVVGAVGARTTPFKTVRIDELALQKRGVTVETFDMADILGKTQSVDPASIKDEKNLLASFTKIHNIPEHALDNIARLLSVLRSLIKDNALDCISMRCWMEIQNTLGISPCVILGILNDAGIPAACEVDTGNAVMMAALQAASNSSATLLDWNNNYGDEEDKCILFHCGPVPASLMEAGSGCLTSHALLANSIGPDRGYGCNVGRMRPFSFTFGGLLTRDGDTHVYLGNGDFTEDPIPSDFFGCAGVARIQGLEDVLLYLAKNGHRHHVALTEGNCSCALEEALGHYLGYQITRPQNA